MNSEQPTLCAPLRTETPPPGTHPGRVRSRRRATSALAVLTLGLALFAPAAAHAAPAQPVTAPAGTVEVWIDVESEAARTQLARVSHRSGSGSWAEAPVATTPFGATAVAAAAPGEFDVRFAVRGEKFSADVALTFADASGRVLGELLVRNAELSPSLADAQGWITWQSLLGGAGDPSEGDSPASGVTPSGAGAAAGQLSRTGADSVPLAFIAFALTAAGLMAAGIGFAERRRRVLAYSPPGIPISAHHNGSGEAEQENAR